MNKLFSYLKMVLREGYKREFYFWLFTLLFFCGGLLFFLIELKLYLFLKESYNQIHESMTVAQSKVVKLKQFFQEVDLKREFKKTSQPITLTIDLKDINQAARDLRSLIPDEETYFLIKEMKLQRAENKPPFLSIQGELLKFY